jgi:hypothetical protein
MLLSIQQAQPCPHPIREQEAALPHRAELEEVAHQQDHWDPTKVLGALSPCLQSLFMLKPPIIRLLSSTDAATASSCVPIKIVRCR